MIIKRTLDECYFLLVDEYSLAASVSEKVSPSLEYNLLFWSHFNSYHLIVKIGFFW